MYHQSQFLYAAVELQIERSYSPAAHGHSFSPSVGSTGAREDKSYTFVHNKKQTSGENSTTTPKVHFGRKDRSLKILLYTL